MSTRFRTMQDLLDGLDGLGYSKKVVNQIRPQIKRCATVYKTPLARIPADLADFERRWGHGRVGALQHGFGSHDQFVKWRRRVRAALGRAARGGAAPAAAPMLPDAVRVVDFVKKNGGVGRLVPPHLEHSIGMLACRAAATGVLLRDLTGDWIEAIGGALKGTDRRTFRNGLASLNGLILRRDELLPIAALLPPVALPELSRGKAAPAGWRRAGGRPEAARIWGEFDAFVAWKRGADDLGRPVPAEESKFRKRTAESYENNLAAALGELERIGWLQPGDEPGLADICNAAVIRQVHNAALERALAEGRPTDRETLHTLVVRLTHIATAYLGVKKGERKELAKLVKQVRKKTSTKGAMSRERLEWIKAFGHDPMQQRAVDNMPETLRREAQRILDRWDELGRARRRKEQMTALSLGIAACIAAILFRGSPVRAANARSVRHEGESRTLILDEGRTSAQIDIPGSETKNGVPIDAPVDDDALPIIDWFLREIRPRLINDHPYGHNLVDSDYLFPSTRADAEMEETTFAKHYRAGCLRIGVDMVLHQARHISAFYILDADPNAWAAAAAVLCDDIETVRAYYAWMDDRKACATGRTLLKQARARRRQHIKGAGLNAA